MQAGHEWAAWLDGDEEDDLYGDSHLVLWSSGLSALPDPTQLPPMLSVLDLRHNKVRELPEDLKLLSNLQHLDLTSNCLEALPDALSEMPKLRGLFLGRNELQSVPDTVGQLTNLEILRLDHNKLIQLPWQLGNACSLQVLSITFNRLTSLPCELALLSSLKQLSLLGNPLITPSASRARDVAPGALQQARETGFASDEREADTCFALGKGSLSREAHDQLLGFLSLQLLAQNYSFRDLTEVPESALRVRGMQSLRLHNNKLRRLPDALGLLCGLRLLDAAHNLLSSVPAALSALTALQELNLADNLIANSARAEKELGTEDAIPAALGDSLVSLQTLLLSRNKIIWIPPAVLQMPLLTLDFSHNRLRVGEPRLCEVLGKRRRLALNRGAPRVRAEQHLPELPPHCPFASSVRLLHLGYNEIRELDCPLFRALTSIEELIVESNLIRAIPECVGERSESMQLLWAGANRVEAVPAALGKLSNLRSLRLETNNLRTIPVELGQCTKLEDLNLFNNPSLYQPPQEVVVRGCLAIVAYLQRLLEAKCLRAPDEDAELDALQAGIPARAERGHDDEDEGEDEDRDRHDDLDDDDSDDDDDDGDGDQFGFRKRRSEEAPSPAKATDVLGDSYLPAASVSEPKHAVRYLNQDCHLLRVFCEGDKVFVDLRVLDSNRVLVRIPEHMIT